MLDFRFEMAKSMFFDRARILTPAREAEKKVLSRFGAYCMRVARNSIKDGDNLNDHSQEGDPPRNHHTVLGGAGFRGSILFVWDRPSQAVYIGGALLDGATADNPVPGVLEHGGDTVRNRRVIFVAPRPHMGPAFLKTCDKLADWLRDCVTNEAGHAATYHA